MRGEERAKELGLLRHGNRVSKHVKENHYVFNKDFEVEADKNIGRVPWFKI